MNTNLSFNGESKVRFSSGADMALIGTLKPVNAATKGITNARNGYVTIAMIKHYAKVGGK